jgi:hypothetical protein
LKRQTEAGDRAATISPIRHHEYQSPLKRGENEAEQQPDGAEDKIICLIKTNEPHIRRAVERRSHHWYDSRIRYQGSGCVYDIKFEFQDQPSDYSSANLKSSQMYNHFQYNTEITTKSGLCKNLYQNTHTQMKVDSWFPRCYDLSQTGQVDDLIDDYQRTAVQIIIKQHYQMIKAYCRERMVKAY